MSIKKDIFKQIGDYLMNALQTEGVDHPHGIMPPELELPGLQFFDKQMGQFINPELANAIPLPGILMEYGQLQWETVGKNQQKGSGTLRFTIYFENYADSFTGSINQETALKFFEFTEQVHIALQGLTLPHMAPLMRASDNEDTAEDMIITSAIEYNTVITDVSSDYSRKYIMTDPEVKIERVKQTSRPATITFDEGFITQ